MKHRNKLPKDNSNKAHSNDSNSKDDKMDGSTLRSMMKHFGAISGSKDECDKMIDSIQKSKIDAEF